MRDLKERYPFVCPACEKRFYAAPSMSMMDGRNSGCGTCKGCGAFLHLEIVADLAGLPPMSGETMSAEPMSECLERTETEQEVAAP